MPQEFQQPENSNPLRAQRMTADESRAVIALWQQERIEQTGLTDKPAVPDVAEGLDVSVEDIQRLLMEVRARRLEEEHQLAAQQKLSAIEFAEKERKLAEVQRQRAELERQRAEYSRKQSEYSTAQSGPVRAAKRQSSSPIGIVIAAILLLLWVSCVVTIVSNGSVSPLNGLPSKPSSGNDNYEIGCPPGYYPVDGQPPSFGCTNVPPSKQNP